MKTNFAVFFILIAISINSQVVNDNILNLQKPNKSRYRLSTRSIIKPYFIPDLTLITNDFNQNDNMFISEEVASHGLNKKKYLSKKDKSNYKFIKYGVMLGKAILDKSIRLNNYSL